MHLHCLGIAGRASLEALHRTMSEIIFSYEKKFWCLQGQGVGGEQVEDSDSSQEAVAIIKKEMLWVQHLNPLLYQREFPFYQPMSWTISQFPTIKDKKADVYISSLPCCQNQDLVKQQFILIVLIEALVTVIPHSSDSGPAGPVVLCKASRDHRWQRQCL